MRVIALEEHVTTPVYNADPGSALPRPTLNHRSEMLGYDLFDELADIGNSRVQYMNEAGIDVQVLSLVQPGTQAYEAAKSIAMAKDANDRMYEAMRAHPTRFAAFAALPTADPKASVAELERCVGKLGFKGTMINGHTRGEFLDDKKYWPILEAAAGLDVPIYLHPREPHPDVFKVYFAGGYEDLGAAAWGYAMDTCSHFLRIMFSGVFDAYPNLKFVLGHLGEGLPFWIDRMVDHTTFGVKRRGLKKSPAEYLTQNVMITCSGNWSVPAFMCSLLAVGIDNMMFSVDWPFESNKVAMEFLKRVPLSAPDLEKFAHGNAERLLKL
jgi:predicted TIM-barrel fold metal-dependent hydrolase